MSLSPATILSIAYHTSWRFSWSKVYPDRPLPEWKDLSKEMQKHTINCMQDALEILQQHGYELVLVGNLGKPQHTTEWDQNMPWMTWGSR